MERYEHKPIKKFPKNLENAGFFEHEIASLMETGGKLVFSDRVYFEPPVSEEYFRIISQSLEPRRDIEIQSVRARFLRLALTRKLFAGDESVDDGERVTSAERFVLASNKLPSIKADFGKVIKHIFDRDNYPDSAVHIYMQFASEVIGDAALYEMFGRSPDKLISFFQRHLRESSSFDLGKIAYHIASSAHGKRLLKDATPEIFNRLANVAALPEIVQNRKLAEIFAKHLSGNKTWAEKYQIFDSVFEAAGLPLVHQKDFDNLFLNIALRKNPEVRRLSKEQVAAGIAKLSREVKAGHVKKAAKEDKAGKPNNIFLRDVQKRIYIPESDDGRAAEIAFWESPWNPVTTLVARTTGNEIEFPKQSGESELAERLAVSIGYKQGVGGGYPKDYTETSPGPYWSPKTAVYVFGKFVDAGVIDMVDNKHMSVHMNAGVSTEWMLPFVRAMQATGAGTAVDQKLSQQGGGIHQKTRNNITYTECKSFAAVTRHETEWLFEHFGYLTYGLGAKQELETAHGIPVGYKWKNTLRETFDSFMQSANQALFQVDLYDFLYQGDPSNSVVIRTVERLKNIFSVPGARFGLLPKIDERYDPKILSVEIQGVIYPNFPYFLRVSAENHTRKIKGVMKSILEEAIYDIKRIDRSGDKRESEIQHFINKYDLEKTMTKLRIYDKFRAYSEVRKVLGFEK